MNTNALGALAMLACAVAPWGAAWAQAVASKQEVVPVTVDNFVRAESDRYFAGRVRLGGFGKLDHFREPVPLDKVSVVRINRDTLYSVGVFDLEAGPVTVTLPDAGKRYLSMVAISEDQHVSAATYEPGPHTYTKDGVGTRYVMVGVRILFDPASPDDLKQVHALQDAIRVSQQGTGRFEVPAWDQASLKKLRGALFELGKTLPDSRGMFGTSGQVTPVRHLVGAAIAWGGNHEKDALYLNVTPRANDGSTVYRLHVRDVPVDGFWSVSVYDDEGWFRPNPHGAYAINTLTARKGADGSVDIQFGGCDGAIPNCLPTMPGWNYMVRLYRPRTDILSGAWTFPSAQPVSH